jgi:hypothetical protein
LISQSVANRRWKEWVVALKRATLGRLRPEAAEEG